jgi:hypothetical protein
VASPWIERTVEGYTGHARDGDSKLAEINVPLPRENIYQELVDVGCHPRDVLDELSAADHFFTRGLNEDRRYVDELRRRAARDALTPDDLAWIARTIERDDSGFRRSGMILLLGRASAWDYEDLIAGYLYRWDDFWDAEAALNVLLDWELGEKYERRIVDLLHGAPEDDRHELQSWIFASLAWRVSGQERGGVVPSPLSDGLRVRLLTEMVAVAENIQPGDHRRFGMISNLATAVGYGVKESLDAAPEDVFVRAHTLLNRQASFESQGPKNI